MPQLVVQLALSLESMFIVGSMGSLAVLVRSRIEDMKTVFLGMYAEEKPA